MSELTQIHVESWGKKISDVFLLIGKDSRGLERKVTNRQMPTGHFTGFNRGMVQRCNGLRREQLPYLFTQRGSQRSALANKQIAAMLLSVLDGTSTLLYQPSTHTRNKLLFCFTNNILYIPGKCL